MGKTSREDKDQREKKKKKSTERGTEWEMRLPNEALERPRKKIERMRRKPRRVYHPRVVREKFSKKKTGGRGGGGGCFVKEQKIAKEPGTAKPAGGAVQRTWKNPSRPSCALIINDWKKTTVRQLTKTPVGEQTRKIVTQQAGVAMKVGKNQERKLRVAWSVTFRDRGLRKEKKQGNPPTGGPPRGGRGRVST